MKNMFCIISFYIFIFVFGLIVGSFLNVVINRLRTNESIWFNRSHCPKCKKTLKWFELIPLLSFALQKGKCRYCKKKISWQYPLVELATGLLFLIIFNSQFPISNFQTLNLTYYFFIVSVLIIIFTYDLKHYIIPDKVVFPGIVLAFLYNFLIFLNLNHWKLKIVCLSVWQENWQILVSPIVAAIIASGFFLLLVLISRGKWMGLGDVKLAIFMGLVLGWPNILVALLISFFFGAIVGLALIALKKKKLKSEIPFGPFLCLATFITLLYGSQILSWYLDAFHIIPW